MQHDFITQYNVIFVDKFSKKNPISVFKIVKGKKVKVSHSLTAVEARGC